MRLFGDGKSKAGIVSVLLLFAISVIAFPSALAFSNGQNATAVAGQPNFTTGGCDGSTQPVPSQTTLCFLYGVAIDSFGNLWVADTSNARVVEFPVTGGVVGSTESGLIGQTSYSGFRNNEGGSPSDSTVAAPFGIAFDSHGDLWVADTENNRVLEFPLVGGTIQTTATEVIGQTSYSGFGCNEFTFSSDTTLCEPTGLAFDSSGNLWVADADNSRVLEFPSLGSTISTTASELIGQTSYAAGSASQACNQAGPGNPPAPPTASTLCFPTALAFDRLGNLWVTDESNSRVLEFPASGSVIRTTANEVLGQPGFTTDSCNLGVSTPTASTLCAPWGIATDSSGDVWVSDTSNNRVLEFPPVGGGTAATLVLGQSTFSGHNGNAGQFPAPVAFGLSQQKALAFDSSGNLWVADMGNSRALEFGAPTITPTTTSVSCAPNPVDAGSPTTCTATVTGSSPTGSVSFSGSSLTGTFSPSTACTLSSGSCSVAFTDTAAGSDIVTANYAGDAANGPSSGTTKVSVNAVLATTTTSVSCIPASVAVGVSSTCTVSVTGSSPTGTVAMTSSQPGSFSGPCVLSAGSCSVGYSANDGSEGANTITATYPGDSLNAGSSGTFGLTVTQRTSGTSVSCAPSSVSVGVQTVCTATVTDTGSGTATTPTGAVGFTSSATGTFSASSCSLTAGSCSVDFTPGSGSEGTVTITGTYGGDTDHTGSSGSAAITATTRTTSVSLTCAPVVTHVGVGTLCTVTVTDTSPGTPITPTGTVALTSALSRPGTFSGACVLSGSGATASCSVTFTPSKIGPYRIDASYVGDADHTGGTDHQFLLVV